MNWYKKSQSTPMQAGESRGDRENLGDRGELGTSEDFEELLLEEDNWRYKAYGEGFWSLGDYSIDGDDPLGRFIVQVKDVVIGARDNLEEAMELASEHYTGYADIEGVEEITPYQKIEKVFGYTEDPKLAGYILEDGKMVNLQRPNLDHREVTSDGTTKSMQEFMADGNIRMGFYGGYLTLDIVTKPTGSQKRILSKILQDVYEGCQVSLGHGYGEYLSNSETYSPSEDHKIEQYEEGISPSSVMGHIEAFYGEQQVYPSQFSKFLSNDIRIRKIQR